MIIDLPGLVFPEGTGEPTKEKLNIRGGEHFALKLTFYF